MGNADSVSGRGVKWSVPKIWEGETVAIMASGPSMNQATANAVRGLKTIAVNSTFRLAPWCDMLYASDARWWNQYKDDIAEYRGLKVGIEAAAIPGLLLLTNTGSTGFDDDPANVRVGGNSGYAAIHVAIHAGCKRILLCGFDMHGQRWHGRHPEPLRNPGQDIFPRWIANFATLVPELEKRGVEVVNCSPDSALKCFPMIDLKDALQWHL
jgi:hypothetical protein